LFAWTIKNPLTAAFLGAFYFTALVLAFLSSRERMWARARVGVPGVFVFITLTFVATLLHLGQFHFHADDVVPKGAAYLWFVIYLVDPLLVAILWPLQLRRPGSDPPREGSMPLWYRAGLAGPAVVLLGLGIALFAAPEHTAGIWPWTLTPITGRVAGAWLWAIGAAAAIGVWERDWRRLRAPLAAYVVLAVLAGVAFARYPGTVDWDHPSAAGLVVLLASMLALGVVGLRAGIEAERPASAEAATTA
jgi:hypothetical protein